MKLANEIKGQLVAAKEQIAALRQQLEEANRLKDLAEKARLQAEEDKIKVEKERDEAEQHGYDVGVAETEDTLRAEVPAICRTYCAQTWEEALNQARVEASSGLRRPLVSYMHSSSISNKTSLSKTLVYNIFWRMISDNKWKMHYNYYK